VVLVSTASSILDKTEEELKKQLPEMSRYDTAAIALSHAYACLFDDEDRAFDFINAYAPEHLIIASDNATALGAKVKSAGSVFLGHYTPESAGDYASGTNHTLPTAAFAKTYSGVSLDSFIKKITFQEISPAGIKNLGETIMTMAKHEQLTAHAQAVQVRLEEL